MTRPMSAPRSRVSWSAGETASAVMAARGASRGDGDRPDLRERRVRRHEVPGEAELLGGGAEGEADELGEMEHRHVEIVAGDLLRAVLEPVEGDVAQRARGRHG